MSLRSKLKRLGASPPLPEVRAPSVATTDGQRDRTLAELRVKMGELLNREPRPAPTRTGSNEALLPFESLEQLAGTLYRRRVVLPPSKSIGRLPLDAAAFACPKMLSLLALDPKLRDCEPRAALYLDTETTGLGGGAGTLAFLVGLAYIEEQKVILEQLLLMTPADEPALLDYLGERLKNSAFWVTFNGKSFDWPLLKSRYVMNRRRVPEDRPHLDLLHVARRLHKKRLGSVTLKRLESEVLGLERGPDIDGAEIGPRYGHFLRTGDAEVLRDVIEHNGTDVLSMLALVGLYGEPLDLLNPVDLTQLAATLLRGKEQQMAAEIATLAKHRGGGSGAYWISGRIAKARGDKRQALADFESLAEEVRDDAVRLELAKLYEHFVRDPERALAWAREGTQESPERREARMARLQRKLERG